MCGDELPASAYAHRFGALAVMSPPISDFGDVQLSVPEAPIAGHRCGPLLHRLREPLHLHVGEDQNGNRGIIGRRVSMYRVPASAADRTPATVVAEGIVGYNSLPRMEASL
ncbi:hypothetical protein SCUCBS95973_007174 [Sporothrix curviconia]|uniref:Uncharacterized protein n=1 Tax=Sporothrix curviconia TaxID=1260050 RepID=A0ABP0CB85_9PEZI